MRKFIAITTAVLLSIVSVNGQYKMKVTLKNGQETEYKVSEIENVTWLEEIVTPDAPDSIHNGHEYVDLGLPSGTKWATCNVGANSPEEYGGYFAWGETNEKSYYEYDTYAYYDNNQGWISIGLNISGTQYDVAHVKWGGYWHMPSYEELNELKEECSWTWTYLNGVWGQKVVGPNGNFIFLPTTGYRWYGNLCSAGSYGYYWSGTISDDYDYNAYSLFFYSAGLGWDSFVRKYGQTVRPVFSESNTTKVASITLDKQSLSLTEGETYKISTTILPSDATDKSITWSSSDASVASVDTSGMVSAIKAGTATITATANDGSCAKATCTITVILAHEYVDLGLSVKWATCNVGAEKPTDFGDYYAWGETEVKEYYGDGNYKYIFARKIVKYCTDSTNGLNGYTDGKTILDPDDDVAHVKLGGSWRMPTASEWNELFNNTILIWTEKEGVNGYEVRSNLPGFTNQSIFLPAAGYCESRSPLYAGQEGDYWSSTLDVSYQLSGWSVVFYESVHTRNSVSRYHGYSVRPVCP